MTTWQVPLCVYAIWNSLYFFKIHIRERDNCLSFPCVSHLLRYNAYSISVLFLTCIQFFMLILHNHVVESNDHICKMPFLFMFYVYTFCDTSYVTLVATLRFIHLCTHLLLIFPSSSLLFTSVEKSNCDFVSLEWLLKLFVVWKVDFKIDNPYTFDKL